MTDPITPSPELVKQWASDVYSTVTGRGEAAITITIKAARWGADQELEACCEWLDQNTGRWDLLAELRRALEALDD